VAFRQREVDEAWAVLRSPADRARYDEQLHATRTTQPAPSAARLGDGTRVAVDVDDLPVLEVLDATDPAGAAGKARGRGRRWRRATS